MKVIVIASRKGGAGKTTLASHLAVQAADGGATPVGIVDVDSMAGLSRWWDARASPYPTMARPDPDLPAALATLQRAGARLAFVDTAPAASATVAAAMGLADLVVVPVQPSPDDLGPIGMTVDMINLARKPMVFVINRTKPRVSLTGQAAIILSQHGTVAPVFLADRAAYAGAKTDGRTAPELDPAGPAATEMAALWAYLAQRLELTP